MKRILIELTILFFISGFIVFFQFNQVPKKLSWDEIEFARLALSLDGKPYTPYSQLATGHSTLYFYLLLLSLKTFGVTNFALRFPSALFAVLNVFIFYLIARLVFPNISYFPKGVFKKNMQSLMPFTATFIFVSLRWYFNFARFSFEATFLLFLELTAIYFFIKFIQLSFWESQNRSLRQKSKLVYLLLSAIFSGLAFHSYYPGRIFFLLPLFFLFFSIKKGVLKKYIFIFLIVFTIIVSPLLFYFLSHKDIRIKGQLFLNDKNLTTREKLSYFGQNITKLISMFHLAGDLNGRHNYPGKPTFNPVVGAFFILGFLVAILNLQNFFNQFFLIYLAISLLPALFTYPIENPNILRTYTATVSTAYITTNGLIYLFQSELKLSKLYLLVAFSLLVLFLAAAFYDLRTYFKYQKIVFKKSFELSGSLNKILRLKLWEKVGEL